MHLDVGAVVDRYTICGVLGHGGMATVYRVRHDQLGTFHAMKVLTVPSRAIRERLVLEGRLQASLHHPNIVTVNDVVTVDGAPGLVMELIRGPSLDKVISANRLSLEQCDALVPGILAGVAAAHARGLVHRDLKPHNIMLQITDQGLVPKITDFGLAKVLQGETSGPTQTRSGAQMGTPAYMAPEQVRNAKAVDSRADLFALGAILYEMVTGHRAFEGEDLLEIFNAIGAGRYTPVRERVPDLPDRVVRAIEGALVVDREQRIGHCETLSGVWKGEIVASETILLVPKEQGPFSAAFIAKFDDPDVSGDTSPAPADEAPVDGGRATFADLTFDHTSMSEEPEPIADLLEALKAPSSARPPPKQSPMTPTPLGVSRSKVPPPPIAPPIDDDADLPDVRGTRTLIWAAGIGALALLVLVAGVVGKVVAEPSSPPPVPVVEAPIAEPPPPTEPAPAEVASPTPSSRSSSSIRRTSADDQRPGGSPEPTAAAPSPDPAPSLPPPPPDKVVVVVPPAPTPPPPATAAAITTTAATKTAAATATTSPRPPTPPASPPPNAHVLLSGGAKVRAVGKSGAIVDLPADLTAGTYTITVYFATARDWLAVQELTVASGETVTLKCSSSACKVTR